jgi:RimJ/RimL family protein N-acetyltransferase
MLIRDADISDLLDIFIWRNDVYSRSMFVDTSAVKLNEHVDWYDRSLKDPLRTIYIGVVEDIKVGLVRFDYDKNSRTSEVSINLNPKSRGNGYGATLLSLSIDLYRRTNQFKLVAIIKKENLSSLKIFEKCNFRTQLESAFFYHLTRE